MSRPHILGLIDLLRFGIASSGTATASSIAAAWLLNVCGSKNLPLLGTYQRKDGTGFPHCDGDWLDSKLQQRGSVYQDFLAAIKVVEPSPIITRVTAEAVSNAFQQRRPSVLVGENTLSLVLAYHHHRRELFVCEIDNEKARLRTIQPASQTLASLHRQRNIEDDRKACGDDVTMASCEKALDLLPKAEGLPIVAYAALHGHTQRDLSSCQVASLSSVTLPRGERKQVVTRAQDLVSADSTTQGTLRALAAHQLRSQKDEDFEFRGLSIHELADLAETIGLRPQPYEVPKATAAELDKFRSVARASLGRIIVNFSRPALSQAGAGHHAVLVAYHPQTDQFLVDDPAGFKMPAYWVKASRLLRAMATFDETAGVKRWRGFMVIDADTSRRFTASELSMSVILESLKS